jgi:hypothetical protein
VDVAVSGELVSIMPLASRITPTMGPSVNAR